MSKINTLILLVFLAVGCQSSSDNSDSNDFDNSQNTFDNDRAIVNEPSEQEIAEKLEKEQYDKYIDNALKSGAMPYKDCYGENKKCSGSGCSYLEVKAAPDADVVVTVKESDKVIRHFYIQSGHTEKVEFPNGTYQVFFYSGIGWNPEKLIAHKTCGDLYGGFVANESFGKDDLVKYKNQIMTYELVAQVNGNFAPASSTAEEAF